MFGEVSENYDWEGGAFLNLDQPLGLNNLDTHSQHSGHGMQSELTTESSRQSHERQGGSGFLGERGEIGVFRDVSHATSAKGGVVFVDIRNVQAPRGTKMAYLVRDRVKLAIPVRRDISQLPSIQIPHAPRQRFHLFRKQKKLTDP